MRKESVNEGRQQLVSIVLGFGLGFKTIEVFSQVLRFGVFYGTFFQISI